MNFSEKLEETISFFVFVFIELSILFLLISFFVELMNYYINPNKIKRLLSSKKKGYLTASLLGSLSPFCTCSTIPFTIGLLKARASFGPVMTFLFTSPILNPMMIALLLVTFNLQITLFYALIAISSSLLAGYILEKYNFECFVKPDVIFDTCCNNKAKFTINNIKQNKLQINTKNNFISINKNQKIKQSKKEIMISIMKKTFKQFVSFIPYFAIGIAIGAVIHGFIPKNIILEYANKDNIFAVPFSAVLGIPLYMRATTMIGIAPELLNSGLSMGALISLTIGATGASIPEVILLKRIFHWQLIVFFLASVFLMAIGCGYLINIFF